MSPNPALCKKKKNADLVMPRTSMPTPADAGLNPDRGSISCGNLNS